MAQPRTLHRLLAVAMTTALLAVSAATAAVAAQPAGLTLTGQPTAAEAAEIEAQWARFSEAFGGFADCMGPIEVMVVTRAEDWYGGRNVGSIAAFYDPDPVPMVIIEHRKVVPANLLHEFAHHLDVSCGIGATPAADALREAHGIPGGRGWFSGTSWRDVPAEVFAESVVSYFGEDTEIAVGDGEVGVVADLTTRPDPAVQQRNLARVESAVAALRDGAARAGTRMLHAV